jgi:hypothetical protein
MEIYFKIIRRGKIRDDKNGKLLKIFEIKRNTK